MSSGVTLLLVLYSLSYHACICGFTQVCLVELRRSSFSDLREIGWDGVDWIDMGQERDQWRALVNTILNLRVP
jgi:hypothetical protein